MKKIAFLVLALVQVTIAQAQGSLLYESLKIDSKILGKEVKYSVYLPDGYRTSGRSYPTLYLLHGYTDDETGWAQFGEVQKIADKAIKSGKATEMIIAMPDGGVSFYINSADGKVKYEEFFVQEFIPHIEKMYRARPKKEFRAVAGLSMGGYGTLIYGLKHPDLFAAAAPLSGAIWTDEDIEKMPNERWNQVMGKFLTSNVSGKDRINQHWKENSIFHIIENTPVEKLRTVRFYIDCGDDDFLIKGNMALHSAMLDKKLPHEFRVNDGGHTWNYWRTALPKVLRFVSQSFHR